METSDAAAAVVITRADILTNRSEPLLQTAVCVVYHVVRSSANRSLVVSISSRHFLNAVGNFLFFFNGYMLVTEKNGMYKVLH